MSKHIYNPTSEAKSYEGNEVPAEGFYQIPGERLTQFQNSTQLISDLALGTVKMSADGSSPLSGGGSDHVNFLKDIDLKDENGFTIFAPSFGYDFGLNGIWKGFLYTAVKNTLNIFDELVEKQLKLSGGWYEILDNPNAPDPVHGDYLEFSIVDKDDVLGLFDLYGLTIGVDVLELGKYVRTDYINPWTNARQHFEPSTPADIYEGLYFRTYYNAVGLTNDVNFKVVLKYHEAD